MILCRHRWCFRPIVGYSVWCRRHTELVTLGWEPAPWDERRLVLPPLKPRAPACSLPPSCSAFEMDEPNFGGAGMSLAYDREKRREGQRRIAQLVRWLELCALGDVKSLHWICGPDQNPTLRGIAAELHDLREYELHCARFDPPPPLFDLMAEKGVGSD